MSALQRWSIDDAGVPEHDDFGGWVHVLDHADAIASRDRRIALLEKYLRDFIHETRDFGYVLAATLQDTQAALRGSEGEKDG